MVKAPNATSNGSDASRGIKAKVHTPNKGSQAVQITRLSVSAFAFMPDAGRVAPIRGRIWCLRLVFEPVRIET